jgi:hypothetical protein
MRQQSPPLSSGMQGGMSHNSKQRRYILEDVELADAARALYEAPFVVLAHDKFVSDEPVFTYANQARLALGEGRRGLVCGVGAEPRDLNMPSSPRRCMPCSLLCPPLARPGHGHKWHNNTVPASRRSTGATECVWRVRAAQSPV